MITAIDVSSHQPRDLSNIIAEYGPDLVIIKLYMPWESVPQSHSIDQLNSAKAHGRKVGGYVWGYLVASPRSTIRDACALSRRHGNPLPAAPKHAGDILWLDCETYTANGVVEDRGPDADWLNEAREEAERQGCVLGIYTGEWWWRQYMHNTTEFGDMPLWGANYTGQVPDVRSLPEFGGWTHDSGKIVGKQYRGGPLDLDTFLEIGEIDIMDRAVLQNVRDVFNGFVSELEKVPQVFAPSMLEQLRDGVKDLEKELAKVRR